MNIEFEIQKSEYKLLAIEKSLPKGTLAASSKEWMKEFENLSRLSIHGRAIRDCINHLGSGK